jgi:hypothetical protein
MARNRKFESCFLHRREPSADGLPTRLQTAAFLFPSRSPGLEFCRLGLAVAQCATDNDDLRRTRMSSGGSRRGSRRSGTATALEHRRYYNQTPLAALQLDLPVDRLGRLLRCPVLRSSGRHPRSARGGTVSGLPGRSPRWVRRWVHSDLPRSAPPDSWRSLRYARVPPVDYRDELRPCQPVHHVPEYLSTISPAFTSGQRGARCARGICGACDVCMP